MRWRTLCSRVYFIIYFENSWDGIAAFVFLYIVYKAFYYIFLLMVIAHQWLHYGCHELQRLLKELHMRTTILIQLKNFAI